MTDPQQRIDAAIARHGFTKQDMRRAHIRNNLQRWHWKWNAYRASAQQFAEAIDKVIAPALKLQGQFIRLKACKGLNTDISEVYTCS